MGKETEDHGVTVQRGISQTEGHIVQKKVKDTCGFQHVGVKSYQFSTQNRSNKVFNLPLGDYGLFFTSDVL